MIIGGRVTADMMAQVEEVHLKFTLYVALTLHSQQAFNLGKDTCLFPRFADSRDIGRFKQTIWLITIHESPGNAPIPFLFAVCLSNEQNFILFQDNSTYTKRNSWGKF